MGLRVRNANDGSNGGDIGNRRGSTINSMHVVGIVWPPTGAAEMLIVTVKAMMLWATPTIGISTGVVIWSIWIGLGAQGA